MSKKPFILGIETSCDETAASIITESEQGIPVVLSNIVSSQIDVIRGVNSGLASNQTAAEYIAASDKDLVSFDSDGFTLGAGEDWASVNQTNGSSIVAWNWKAGGSAPSKTYVVTVVSDSGNKYRFDGFGTSAVTLNLQEGGTYKFDQSHSSNSGHPFRFGTSANGSNYTTGVTTSGTPGNSGAYTRITVAAGAPTLYYACSAHSGMGGQANTNSTAGSSNFSGTIQSNISANVDAGFSIVSWTGNATSGATIGHGLSKAPELIINRQRSGASNWLIGHTSLGFTKHLELETTGAVNTVSNIWNDQAPTASVFYVGNNASANGNNETFVTTFLDNLIFSLSIIFSAVIFC